MTHGQRDEHEPVLGIEDAEDITRAAQRFRWAHRLGVPPEKVEHRVADDEGQS